MGNESHSKELKKGMSVFVEGKPGKWKIEKFLELGGVYVNNGVQNCVFVSRLQITPIPPDQR